MRQYVAPAGDILDAVSDAEFNGMKLPMGLESYWAPTLPRCSTNLVKVGNWPRWGEEHVDRHGSGVNLKNVEVEGTLIIKACEGARHGGRIEGEQQGLVFAVGKKATKSAPWVCCTKNQQAEYTFDKPGTYFP